MKVTTDGCLFGAWVAREVKSEKSKVKNVLDIGTGTAVLSLMFAQQNPDATIDAVEIDKGAYEQAKENIAASPWKDQIQVFNADIKNHVWEKKYDFIICNPPFYENELQSPDAKKNTAHHSSNLSLTDLLTVSKTLLSEKGRFYFLFPYQRKEEVEKLISANSLFVHETVLVKQSLQHDYFRIMIAGGFLQQRNINTKEISVRDNEQQYTNEFIDLLKDYYLYL